MDPNSTDRAQNVKVSMSQSIFQAVVASSYPGCGMVIVQPGTQVRAGGQNLTCRLPLMSGPAGCLFYSAPTIGSKVIVYCQKGKKVGQVICSLPHGDQKRSYTDVHNVFGDDFTVAKLGKSMTQFLYSKQKRQNAWTIAGAGAAVDIQPGDVQITDKNGGGLVVGRTITRMFQGSYASVQVQGIQDRLLTTGKVIDQYTLTSQKHQDDNLSYSLKAFSAKQSLGNQNPKIQQVTVNEQSYMYLEQDSNAPSLYRIQHLQGLSVLGTTTTIITPPVDSWKQTKPFTNQQFNPVYTSKISYSGASTVKSAQAIRSIKTPYITAQTKRTTPWTKQLADQEADYKYKDKSTRAFLGVDYCLKFNKIYSSQGFQQSLDKSFQFPTDQQDCDIQLLSSEIPKKLSKLNTRKASTSRKSQYLDVKYGNTKGDSLLSSDNVAYYDGSSFLSQQVDGSILIKDAWGSEIRMYGGNIYISPALDLFLRPGRDLIGMVPRQTDVQTGKHISLSCAQDIDIGAQKDLKLASGISGKAASTTLQNRSTQTNNQKGIVIRSNNSLSLTAAQDMYIGIDNIRTEQAGDYVTRNTNGKLIIDAANTTLLSTSSFVLAVNKARIYSGYSASTASSGSMIQFLSSSISIMCPSMMIDSSIMIGDIAGEPNLIVVGDKNGDQTIQVKSSSNRLIVNGSVIARDGITTKSLTARKNIIASGYVAIDRRQTQIPAAFQVGSQEWQNFISSIEYSLNLTISYIPVTLTASTAACYSDKFICNQQYVLRTFAVQGNVPGMCWQTDEVGQYVYKGVKCVKETGSDQLTYSYPGNWGDEKVYITTDWNAKKDQVTTAALNTYKTNTDTTDQYNIK